uniref:Venom S1 protease with CUB domain 18 n=1 Tax=Platymeris rhadamanthus TaxID=1134088 RepID=A0A6B9L965_PLARH|nr:venom S1 protease with CUB domain 18 [Platymeris rhadamanthus]
MQVSYLLVIFISTLGCVYGQAVYYKAVMPGQPYEDIKNPEYPKGLLSRGSSIQWNLVVEADSTIKVLCDDIRMGQHGPWTDDCPHVYLSFDEGNGETKICGGNKGGYQYRSKGPKLFVRLVSKEGSGLMKCTAYNTKEPFATHLALRPDGRVKVIETPKTPLPNMDRMWTLTSIPGSRISLQCSLSFSQSGDQCYKDILIINDGERTTEYCKSEDLVLFSKKNFAKIRIQLNEFGDRNVRCVVQAVTGPHANQFLNILPEEIDSSEHGVIRGRKGTTCDCGRANKPPPRVTHGHEVRENEFPWMVLLHIYYPIDNGESGYIFSSCGASIITRRHVLTAAHCVILKGTTIVAEPENVRMQLAEHDRSKTSGNEKEVVGEKLFVHDNYLKENTHDIAVIFTKENIEYSLLIGPVCLSPVELPIHNRRIQIMGWGQTETGKGSDVLLKSRALVIDRLICGMAEWEICTQPLPSATCFGDSGGPQVWVDPETNRYTQVGLASRAWKDCRSGPNTQTDVVYFYPWIQDVIQQSDPSQMICQKN